jgi:hypothetical protein
MFEGTKKDVMMEKWKMGDKESKGRDKPGRPWIWQWVP